MPTTHWTVRRSRVPDVLAALMLAGSGAACLTGAGWLWWVGVLMALTGAVLLAVAVRRPPETLRLTLGDRVRLERAGQAAGTPQLLADGLLDGGSVVTPWLLALRIRSVDGTGADLVLTPGSAPADDLRRLRVRLLTDESLRR
ncbi:MAG: hypothetical protein FGM40_07450 [Rhodocyclaceae bacterium]|nr:hypothetical protein [Rhodocyclaceae bacterium]